MSIALAIIVTVLIVFVALVALVTFVQWLVGDYFIDALLLGLAIAGIFVGVIGTFVGLLFLVGWVWSGVHA